MMIKTKTYALETYDPYDLWSTPIGVKARDYYYRGLLIGKFGAVTLGVLDWLMPHMVRRLANAKARHYPIVISHEILRLYLLDELDALLAASLLEQLAESAIDPNGTTGWSWGLGFSWMSKNGLYPDNIPFVTHTPYAMQALLVLMKFPTLEAKASKMFLSTWDFLESLKVMHEDNDTLALSYAPIDEPRIVINANSYAAHAYAMHAVFGKSSHKKVARKKTEKLLRWINAQQQKEGSWNYYADDHAGNFIDCFHSCFVVKNLHEVQTLIPDLVSLTSSSIHNGWKFIQCKLYDEKNELCRRFIKKHINDPYKWDLYDQAEYLGLLVRFNEIEQARQVETQIIKRFTKGEDWYCRIDIFNRQWGKNFQRWGLVPFKLAQDQLKAHSAKT